MFAEGINWSSMTRRTRDGKATDVSEDLPQHEDEIVIGDKDVVWKADSAFGEYLREVREAAGLTLREAAEQFGTSFTYLHRLETGKRTTPPTTNLIEKVARAYGRDLKEVITAAGFVRNVAPDVNLAVDIRVLFDAVISQPGLRPIGLEHRDIGYYSPMQKQQVVDLLLKYEEHRQGGGRTVHEILEETKRRLEAQTLPVNLGDLFKDDEGDEP